MFGTDYPTYDEPVTFSEEEWAIMMADPAFGYVHPCGHPTSPGERRAMETGLGDTHCHRCEADAEQAYYESLGEYEYEREQDMIAAEMERREDEAVDRYYGLGF